jgi:hypothetical protein
MNCVFHLPIKPGIPTFMQIAASILYVVERDTTQHDPIANFLIQMNRSNSKQCLPTASKVHQMYSCLPSSHLVRVLGRLIDDRMIALSTCDKPNGIRPLQTGHLLPSVQNCSQEVQTTAVYGTVVLFTHVQQTAHAQRSGSGVIRDLGYRQSEP